MTSCLSGAGGRAYNFDFDFVKSPSTSIRTSPTSSSSSPSSTISESRNSQLAISTRKPRTSRKRPNQTYNEAATLLSSAYPNLFSTKNLRKPGNKFTKPITGINFSEDDSSELLLQHFSVFDNSSFLLHHKHYEEPFQHNPSFPVEVKMVNLQEKPWQSPGEISSRIKLNSLVDLEDDFAEYFDFDAESILDEEIEEGIDSIMGSKAEDSNGASYHREGAWSGFGRNLDFPAGFPGAGIKAFRRRPEDGIWWNFPTIDILEISPRISNSSVGSVPATEKRKQKKKEKVEKEISIPKSNQGLLLKLNHEEVRDAWSERGSPFVAGEISGSDVPGNDVSVCFLSRFSHSKSRRKKKV